jgi:zinc protease
MSKLYQPEQFFLSNGIPVILQHAQSSVASIYWWVQVGSADETPREAGFAHFLEHMLFKDASSKETGKASSGKTARLIESLGGDINAYTSFDQTVYHVSCASQHWERVLDVFGQMAQPQRFFQEDFQREREVILEEIRKNEDSPGRQLSQSLFTTAFQQHPYGRPVIGWVETIRSAKLAALEKFYQRHYLAERMGLVLVGPWMDASGKRKAKLLGQVEGYFGKKVFKKTKVLLRKRALELPLRSDASWCVKSFDVQTPVLSLAFRVPDMKHEDIAALDLLASILGMGELSRLYQSLFCEAACVTDISAGLYIPKDPGLFCVQAEMDSLEKVEPVLQAICEQFRRIQSEGPTQEELRRVLVHAESERLYTTQTSDGTASRLGFLRFVLGDLDFDEMYLHELRCVDAQKIQEVAKNYLVLERMAGAVLVPRSQSLEVSALQAWTQKFLPKASVSKWVKKEPSKKQEGGERFSLPSGMQVCFYPRPSSQVFSIHASVLGGLRLEEASQAHWGESQVLALTWTKGTSTKTAKQIAAWVEGRASSIAGFSGRNSIGLQMAGLARDWRDLSQIFGEVLWDPQFIGTEIDHSKRIVEDAIRGLEDHSSQLCSKLFLETLFEHHPYGKMMHGSLESIQKVDTSSLMKLHHKWVRPERLVISVSGPVRWSHLDAWLSDLDRQVSSGERWLEVKEEPVLKAPRWVERSLGREQCHILVGGLGMSIQSQERYVLRLLQTLLGGQSGRLFIELREKKSLAYTVAPISFEGLERGYVGTYLACAPQKKEEALQGIREVLERLAEKGPGQKEMARAREFFMGRRAMDLQGDASLASHHGLEALYGLESLTEARVRQKLEQVKAKQVQAFCQKYLVASPQVISVVG